MQKLEMTGIECPSYDTIAKSNDDEGTSDMIANNLALTAKRMLHLRTRHQAIIRDAGNPVKKCAYLKQVNLSGRTGLLRDDFGKNQDCALP
jgi:hypothetical protein